jgi:hypothetical protein
LSKPTAPEEPAAERSTKKAKQTNVSAESYEDNGDNDYASSDQDDDCASDTSGVMSVDSEELEDEEEVEEEIIEGGRVLRSRCAPKDYKLIE